MGKRFLVLFFHFAFLVPLGCSPSEPGANMRAPQSTLPDELTTVEAVETAGTVDPAIDAGMMADEFESNERTNPQPLDLPEVSGEPDTEIRD